MPSLQLTTPPPPTLLPLFCYVCSCRALMVALSAVDVTDLDLDVVDHPLLNIIYYSLVEIIPSAWVLYILRKLPPKRAAQGYQSIPTR